MKMRDRVIKENFTDANKDLMIDGIIIFFRIFLLYIF